MVGRRYSVLKARGAAVHAGPDGVVPAERIAYVEVREEDNLYFLLRLDKDGNCLADTCHCTLDELRR